MFAWLLAATLAFSPEDAEFAFSSAEGLVARCTPRDAGTRGGWRAAVFIRTQLASNGVAAVSDAFVASSPSGWGCFVNVYAEFPSRPDGDWTVLLSHYDTKPGVKCPGANDGAATSGLLMALARRLQRDRIDLGNVLLAWTDAEESVRDYADNDGLQGSRQLVKYMLLKHRRIRAAVCVDMIGDRDLHISMPANGSPKLMALVERAATEIGERGLVSRMKGGMIDDHLPFHQRGYPALDLIDFEYGPGNSWWHTPEDTMDKVAVDSLSRSGRLLCAFLRLLCCPGDGTGK